MVPSLQRHVLFDGKPKAFASLLDENLSLKIDPSGREGGRGLSVRRGVRKQAEDKTEEDKDKNFLSQGRLGSSFFGNERIAIWAKSNPR